MAIFEITAANSVLMTGSNFHAFLNDTPGADTLAVNADGFLIATGVGGLGAFLDLTGAWTVVINGAVSSQQSDGVHLRASNLDISTITIGAGGTIFGRDNGISALSTANFVNAGEITGAIGSGIAIEARTTHTIRNTGIITGGTYSIFDRGSIAAAQTVTNSGTLNGAVSLGGGSDTLTNSGRINGNVDLGIGLDVVTNSGLIYGAVNLGDGNDKLTNSGTLFGGVNADYGDDTLTNSGIIGGNVLLGDGLNKLTNTGAINGGVTGGKDQDIVKSNGAIELFIDLAGGDDRFTGSNNMDNVVDGAGSDTVKLGGGQDRYYAVGDFNFSEDGIDTVDGGAGVDTYDASESLTAVRINLDKAAHDFASLVPGSNFVAASTASGSSLGHDIVKNFENAYGGAGNDFIYGSATANVLFGGDGEDTLAGYGGSDRLHGGAGVDTLWGGTGKDALTGGLNGDVFLFAAVADSGATAATRDLITDFESAIDLINLSLIDANTKNGKVDDAFTFIGDQAFSKVVGQLRTYASAGAQIIEGDVNGDGKADFSIECAANPFTITLAATDFIL